MDNNLSIDIEEMRSNKSDSLPHHLWNIALDCKLKREIYWRYYNKLKCRSNYISIPLVICSTATGFFSVSQLNGDNTTIRIILTIISIISAILASLQKLFRFSERAENAKDMAKNYTRLSRKIEDTMVLVESKVVKMHPDEFTKFINGVQNDCNILLQETNDIPDELIRQDEDIYKNKVMKDIKGGDIDELREINMMMTRDISDKK